MFPQKLEKKLLVLAIVQSLLISITLLWSNETCSIQRDNAKSDAHHEKEIVPLPASRSTWEADPEVMTNELRALSSSDEIHIRSCFYEDLQITCLVDIQKTLLATKPTLMCPDNVSGEIVSLQTNTWREEKWPAVTNDFVKFICSCKDSHCSNYKEEIELNRFWFIQGSTRWNGPLLSSNNPTNSYTYPICSVSAVLQGKPPAMDLWIKHHWESGVDHMFMYASEFHIPSKVYSTLKEQSYIEEIFWPAHYGLDQSRNMGQDLAFLDALFRFRGICEWTLFLDIEHYFWLPEYDHSIPYCLEKEVGRSGNHIHTFLLPWQEAYSESCSASIPFTKNDDFVCPMVEEQVHSPMRIITKTELLVDLAVQPTNRGYAVTKEAKIAPNFGFQFLNKTTPAKPTTQNKQHPERKQREIANRRGPTYQQGNMNQLGKWNSLFS